MFKRLIQKINDSLHSEYEMTDVDRFSLMDQIQKLNDRIEVLEEENVETTNELYRLQNSLDARIDILYNEFKSNERH